MHEFNESDWHSVTDNSESSGDILSIMTEI